MFLTKFTFHAKTKEGDVISQLSFSVSGYLTFLLQKYDSFYSRGAITYSYIEASTYKYTKALFRLPPSSSRLTVSLCAEITEPPLHNRRA